MVFLTDALSLECALDSAIDHELKKLLSARCEQLLTDTDHEYELAELAHFLIVGRFNTIAEIEDAAGYPLITCSAFEWVQDHGRWYEAATILSDDGFGIVLFIPNEQGIDPVLLSLLRAEAIATAASASPAQADCADSI